jgi:patatin-like phospholipase/acyl hydrolase
MAANMSVRPLRLLALDSGGVRGLSSLLILREILRELGRQPEWAGKGTPKPCEVFDLIGGTATGG